MLALLDKNVNALENKISFTAQLFFNYLIGSPDAHGKNYSVLLDGGSVELAPLYDCASAFAYDGDEASYKAAMAIGGERRFFRLEKSNVRDYARQANLSAEICLRLIKSLAENILEEADGVFAKFDNIEGAQELAVRMIPNLVRNCRGILRSLS